MLDPVQAYSSPAAAPVESRARSGKVLRMVGNDRTAGSIPAWENPSSGQDFAALALGQARGGPAHSAPVSLLAYQENPAAAGDTEEFGFGDLLDMINPLHHVPVVSHFYREITGDTIKPIGRIIGGAVFGGAAGAAVSLANVIVEHETGSDIASNALALVSGAPRPEETAIAVNEKPEERLTRALKIAEAGDLPGSLIAFADLSHGSGIVIEKREAPPRVIKPRYNE